MLTLPAALAPMAAYRQFIVYQLAPSATRPGKTDKFPVHPITLRKHDAGDTATHLSAEEAIQAAQRAGPGYGVGFYFSKHDPFWFIDIDNCLVDGAWSETAALLCRVFAGAAVEVSSSGRGLHLFGTGAVPPHGTRDKARGLEFYTSGRFVALTGLHAQGNAAQDFTLLFPSFVSQWFPPGTEQATSAGWTTEPLPEWRGPTDDDELIRRALRSQSAGSAFNGKAAFADLWQANADVLATTYPPDPNSQEAYGASEADSALASQLLFWTGKNCERTKQLMLRSALAREKWNAREVDYLERTILAAASVVRAVCADKEKTLPSLATEKEGKKFGPVIFAVDLADFFEGCVYVQDNNAILLKNGDLVDQPRFNAAYPGKLFCMDAQNERTVKAAWDAFLQNAVVILPRAQGTCFRPDLPFQAMIEESGRTWVNVYKKPVVQMHNSDVAPFIKLIRTLLPHGDDWLILDAFLKAIVQYPGVKFDWTVFLQGVPGNGKSTIIQCLRYALGRKYIFNVKPYMIDGNFNGWLENNVLYVGDDIYTYTDRAGVFEALKSMITEREHAVTYKGIDSVQKNICGNFFFMDNHQDGIRKTPDDRRICPLFCAQQNKDQRDADGLTPAWFAKVYYPWLQSGGFEAVAYYLHHGSIDPRYNPAETCTEAPATSSTTLAIESSMTMLEEDIAELIETHTPGFRGGFASVTMLRRTLEKKVSRLKIKEALERLGYDQAGRTGRDVMPDATRSILYVKRGQTASDLAREYESAQLRNA